MRISLVCIGLSSVVLAACSGGVPDVAVGMVSVVASADAGAGDAGDWRLNQLDAPNDAKSDETATDAAKPADVDAKALGDTEIANKDANAKDAPDVTDGDATADAGSDAGPVSNLPVGATCAADAQCAGGNYGCQVGVCVAGKCAQNQAAQGTPCDGCSFCFGPCVCSGEWCSPSQPAPYKCDDGNQCTDDYCDDYQAQCDHEEVDNGPCDDGNPCTVGDHCVEAWCSVETAQCDDLNPCTADSCSGGCVFAPISGTCSVGGACGTCEGGKCVATGAAAAVDLAFASTQVGESGAMAATSDGGVLLVGAVGSDGVGTRLGAKGNLVWQKKWLSWPVVAVAQAKNGGFWLGGASGKTDGFIVAIDASGSMAKPLTLLGSGAVDRLWSAPDGGVFGANYSGIVKVSADGSLGSGPVDTSMDVVQIVASATGWTEVGTGGYDQPQARVAWYDASGKFEAEALGGYQAVDYGMDSLVTGYELKTQALAFRPNSQGGTLLCAVTKQYPYLANPALQSGFAVEAVAPAVPGGTGVASSVQHLGGMSFDAGFALTDGRFLAAHANKDGADLLWIAPTGDILGQQSLAAMAAPGGATGWSLVHFAQSAGGDVWLSVAFLPGSGTGTVRVVRLPLPPASCP